jgi:hypothetical protein
VIFHHDARSSAFNGSSVAFSIAMKSYWYCDKGFGVGGGESDSMFTKIGPLVFISLVLEIQSWGRQTD